MQFAYRVSAVGVFLAGVLLATTPSAAVQGGPTGTLTGMVSDSSGGVLPGVTVTARNLQTSFERQAVTSAEGDWRMPGLPLGRTSSRSHSMGSRDWYGLVLLLMPRRYGQFQSHSNSGVSRRPSGSPPTPPCSRSPRPRPREVLRLRNSRRCRRPRAALLTCSRRKPASAQTCRRS